MSSAAPPVNQNRLMSPNRLMSMDAYRGFVMLLMMGEVWHFTRVSRNFPDSTFWSVLSFHQSHVSWLGCSLHDLIQPSFSFLVGVALPYSIAARMAKGDSQGKLFAHTCWRSLVLILLGVFLRSVGKTQTNWTFEDTLSQIGLGYPILFLLGLGAMRWSQRWFLWAVLLLILAGYWLAFVLYPLAPAGFDYAAVGVPTDWTYHAPGIAGHFNKNSNLAWAFDTWFLNLFPRVKPFTHNGGGYATLSFIPTLGTMILGLIAGRWLRETKSDYDKVKQLALAGAACIFIGWLLGALGLCPVVKKIWTPSWTLFSGGWCFILLALFYGFVDALGQRAWAFVLVVIGMNSIAAYVIAHLWDGFILDSWRVHFGQNLYEIFGKGYAPFVSGTFVMVTFWLILHWMYRRKLFLRI